MPNIAQLIVLALAIVVLAAGGAASLARLWREGSGYERAARGALLGGIVLCVGVWVWHRVGGRGWVPLGDNFDALLSLGILLSLFVVYVQRHGRMGGLDWFVMPVVLVLLILALVFGRIEYRSYASLVRNAWMWVHYATAFLGAAAFAIAAASGAMYVLTSRKLRSKVPVSAAFGSLERLEHLTMSFVVLGFALLTIGAVTGLVQIVEYKQHTSHWKLALAGSAWIVYAIVLHAPINPSFRGRKAAMLSILGFALMVGTVLAVLLTGGSAQ